MDCVSGRGCREEDSAACHALFPKVSYDGQGGNRGGKSVCACGSCQEIFGVCVCRELLNRHTAAQRKIEFCEGIVLWNMLSGFVGVLRDDDRIVGTGCYKENHITRVYVKPEDQGKGYGSYMMQCLENQIRLQYDTVYLDASLPASHLYEKRGYQTTKHEKWNVENGRILVYEVMVKSLPKISSDICYDGKFFVPQRNTENGEVDGNTIFAYHQKDNIL